MKKCVSRKEARMRTVEVVAAIIRNGSCVLATQRDDGDLAGGWEFPGGKQEEGESGEAAAVREIREELGASIAIERFLCTVEHDYPDFHLTMDCYLAHVSAGRLTLTEHSDARWLGIGELDSVGWLPADIKVVEEIKKHPEYEI